MIAPLPAGSATIPSKPPIIRVALVEHDGLCRQAVIGAVNSAPGMELTDVAATLAGALDLLDRPAPDILLIDPGLPDGSGIDMIRAAHFAWPDCNIMVWTAHGDEAHVMRSIEAGASGYLFKDSNLQAGGNPISPLLARQILTCFRKMVRTVTPDDVSPAGARPHLSEREQQVLHLVTRGFTAKEIARLIKVSHNTVLTYVRRIYSKLNVSSKAEAIYEAQHRGLLVR